MRKLFSKIYFLMISLLILTGVLLSGFYLIGIRPYVVQTGSMCPAMPVGSVCFVNHHADYEEIQEGDVIAFRLGGKAMITHRVVRFSEQGIITKGDANRIEDAALVTEENFVGKTIFCIPEIGNFVRYLRTKQGILFLLALAVVLILCGFLLDQGKETKDKKNSPE